MKFKKSLSLVLPLAALVVLSLGFYYANGGNTAGSIAEQLNTNGRIPVVNQQFDLVGAWTTGTALPSARYYGESVSYTKNDSGYVYVMGGDSTGSSGVGRNVYRYSVNGNSWSVVTQTPAPRRIGGAALLGDSIYVVGGIPASNPPVYSVYRYSITQNTWATVGSLPDSLYFNRAQGYQDSLIYNVGGYNGGVAKANVYLFNAKTNTWRSATKLPNPKADGALSICGDTLVYVCGFDSTGFATNVVYRGIINQTDRSQITWTTGANYPPGARSRIYAAPWGPKGIIIAGGASSGFNGTQETYTYSPGANTWTAQTNLPAVMLAYHSGSVKYNSGIWKFVVSGGVTTGPALTGNTYIFTDTLSTPPPPGGGDSVLVMFHDTTVATGQVKRLADRDTVMKYLPGMISKYRTFYFTAASTLPDLTNYKAVILVETSYDNNGALALGSAARTSLKAWLNAGTPTDKKTLISIGGDQAYNYDQAAQTNTDTTFARSFCGMIYRVDTGTPASSGGDITGLVAPELGVIRTLVAPTGTGNTGYYPDGASLAPGTGSRTPFYKYNGHTASDTLGGMSVNSPGFFTLTSLQDPRYFTTDAKGWLLALITYAKTNGGTITSVTPQLNTVADKYQLSQNYPNPFNPTTKITFAIPQNGFVSLKVYDVSGKEVMTLVNKTMTVGTYAVDFNGSFLSSGVYFYRIETGNFVETKKMMLVK
jgi:N-acetylneuraminic acid mutarotase